MASTAAHDASQSSGTGPAGGTFDIVQSYHAHLTSSPDIPMPIASIFALCDLITSVPSNTTSELSSLLNTYSAHLKESLPDPVPPTAGLDLFIKLVNSMQWDATSTSDFVAQKHKLVELAREYAEFTVPSCRERIVEQALPFIRDGAVILTHSYSRVVMQILLAAHKRRRGIRVYVTEARPSGLGLKTHARLVEAGVATIVITDSAAAALGEKIDFVLVGAEGVCESGGVLNAVGTLGVALVAKSFGKPFYVAAESYKFLRLFPLSQFDLAPSHPVLTFDKNGDQADAARQGGKSDQRGNKIMTTGMEKRNPAVDYTLPTYVTFIFSDVGALRPSGVGEALLAVYGGDAD